MFKVLQATARLLGALGLIVCLAGIAGVWIVRAPVDTARQQAFEKVDESLERIDGRLIRVQGLAIDARVSLDKLREQAAEAVRSEATERVAEQLADRLQLQIRADELASALRQGEALLDSSDDVVQYIEQTLLLAERLGAAIDAESVKPLRARLEELTKQLAGAAGTLEQASLRLAGEGESSADLDDEHRRQIVAIVARLVSTFGQVDERLNSARNCIVDARAATGRLEMQLRRQILWAAIAATLFLLWMTAGQFSLLRARAADENDLD